MSDHILDDVSAAARAESDRIVLTGEARERFFAALDAASSEFRAKNEKLQALLARYKSEVESRP